MEEDAENSTNKLKEVFGKNLKAYRIAEGLTQEDLAYAAECSVTYLSEIENFKANPSLELMNKLAFKVKKDLTDLIIEKKIKNKQ